MIIGAAAFSRDGKEALRSLWLGEGGGDRRASGAVTEGKDRVHPRVLPLGRLD